MVLSDVFSGGMMKWFSGWYMSCVPILKRYAIRYCTHDVFFLSYSE